MISLIYSRYSFFRSNWPPAFSIFSASHKILFWKHVRIVWISKQLIGNRPAFCLVAATRYKRTRCGQQKPNGQNWKSAFSSTIKTVMNHVFRVLRLKFLSRASISTILQWENFCGILNLYCWGRRKYASFVIFGRFYDLKNFFPDQTWARF